eukprot:s7840_g2.t1
MAPMPFFGMMPGPGQMVMQQPPPRPSPSPSSVDDGGDADSVTAAMAMLTPKSGPKAKVGTPRSKSLPSKAPHLDAPEPEAAKPKTEGLDSPAVAEKAEHAPAPEVPGSFLELIAQGAFGRAAAQSFGPAAQPGPAVTAFPTPAAVPVTVFTDALLMDPLPDCLSAMGLGEFLRFEEAEVGAATDKGLTAEAAADPGIAAAPTSPAEPAETAMHSSDDGPPSTMLPAYSSSVSTNELLQDMAALDEEDEAAMRDVDAARAGVAADPSVIQREGDDVGRQTAFD